MLAMANVQPGSAAFILAGGKSSRMGHDKAFLELRGRTLLDIARGHGAEICETVTAVGDRSRFGPDAIEDIFSDSGPLGGIHAALASSKVDLNLILAVDTPFLNPKFLRWMLQQAASSGAVVTFPKLATGYQPLCAVYRRSFENVAEDALKNGRFKIDALYEKVSTRPITDAELKQLAFDSRMFDNLNTRADFERALKAKK
jgi:molybdopterin-guanine dinucleotide biosynthesis protein A